MNVDTGILDEVPIHLVTLPDILRQIEQTVTDKTELNIGYVNAHVLNLTRKHKRLLAHLQALDICYCDGLGPVLALKAHGFKPPDRLPGRLCIPKFLEQAARSGWRVGWVGGETGVAERAVQHSRTQHPDLITPFTTHGFHHKEDWQAIVAQLNEAALDVLLVGMGSPTQESWLTKYRAQLNVPVTWTVGATADYLSGTRRLGPPILLEHQEWLARLIVEPKRMWYRYLVGNPQFVYRTTRSLLWKK